MTTQPDQVPRWARQVSREREEGRVHRQLRAELAELQGRTTRLEEKTRTLVPGSAADTARLVQLERAIRTERALDRELEAAASPAALLGRIAAALERIAASLEGRS